MRRNCWNLALRGERCDLDQATGVVEVVHTKTTRVVFTRSGADEISPAVAVEIADAELSDAAGDRAESSAERACRLAADTLDVAAPAVWTLQRCAVRLQATLEVACSLAVGGSAAARVGGVRGIVREGIAVLVLVVIDDAVSARTALQRVERGAVEQEDDEAEKKRA